MGMLDFLFGGAAPKGGYGVPPQPQVDFDFSSGAAAPTGGYQPWDFEFGGGAAAPGVTSVPRTPPPVPLMSAADYASGRQQLADAMQAQPFPSGIRTRASQDLPGENESPELPPASMATGGGGVPPSGGPAPAAPVPETSLLGRINNALAKAGDGINRNSRALTMFGAGLAGGPNAGKAISDAFTGFTQGAQLDQREYAQNQTAKFLQSKLPGIDEGTALALAQDPKIMQALLPQIVGAKNMQLKDIIIDPATGQTGTFMYNASDPTKGFLMVNGKWMPHSIGTQVNLRQPQAPQAPQGPPPVQGARWGQDPRTKQMGWFAPDPYRPGQYQRVE